MFAFLYNANARFQAPSAMPFERFVRAARPNVNH
jgi:hypothetical protein